MAQSDPTKFDPIEEAHRKWIEDGSGQYANGMSFVTAIMRTHQVMLARVDAVLRPMNLTFARYELLTLLRFSKTGTLPMSKISQRLQVHPTSTTNAVDRLENAGLVKRQAHPRDGRTTLVTLTPQGRALSQRATQALNSEVFSSPGLDDNDLGEILTILAKHRHNHASAGPPASSKSGGT